MNCPLIRPLTKQIIEINNLSQLHCQSERSTDAHRVSIKRRISNSFENNKKKKKQPNDKKKTREQNKSFEHQLTIGATDKINCRIESNECHEIEKKTKRDRIFIET